MTDLKDKKNDFEIDEYSFNLLTTRLQLKQENYE